MKKLLFISPYPTKDNEKDGMIQRIKAIDELYKNTNRIYIWLDLKKGFIPKYFKPEPKCVVIYANLFLYFPIVWLYIFLTPSLLYCHSVIEAIKVIIPIILGKKFILDIHGVVPEEMYLAGNKKYASIFGYVEKISLTRSLFSIVVTKKMKQHYLDKYRKSQIDMILLPIFNRQINEFKNANANVNAIATPTVIYAGGTQPWQNLEKMFQLAQKNKEVDFIFLFSNVDEVKNKFGLILNKINNIKILSVPHQQVGDWYAKANFGLILRDDIVVNRVACPTKLIEYIEYNLIPIIGDCNIGDFVEDGLFFLRDDDFSSASAIEKISAHNISSNEKIINIMELEKISGSKELLKRSLNYL
jgi:hypothetical protein